jgi:Ser/Thr protein kinase RdoA (MazF antagonist)
MASFAHPADSRRLAWDVRHVAELEPLLDEITDAPRRSRLEAGLERLSGLAGRVAALRTQVLHNDFSTSNLLVDGAGGRRLTGVIDFGDAVRTAVAVDVSTALLNQLPRNADPTTDLFAHGRDVLRGYLALTDLTDEELTLVPHLVMARVIARALITTLRARLQPSNRTYILRNTEQGWAQLEWFLRRPVDEVSAALGGGRV